MQQERTDLADEYGNTRPLAIWPSRRAAGRIGAIGLAAALCVLAWSPESPLRGSLAPAVVAPVIVAPEPPVQHVVAPAPLTPAAPLAPPVSVASSAPPAAPVVEVVPAAAVAAHSLWQPPDVPRLAHSERVERWRPLVRLMLAEMWEQGRLDGYAARLDDDLVLALIQQESAGRPNATSWVGAIGLMQVMPFTFAEMMAGDKALADAIDPALMYDLTSNVRAGLRYLALAMHAHEGNLYWALAAYNGGIEAVDAWRAVGLYAVPPIGGYEETANYAQAILRNYLTHRPDVKMHVPDPMPPEHLPGAVELLLRAGLY